MISDNKNSMATKTITALLFDELIWNTITCAQRGNRHKECGHPCSHKLRERSLSVRGSFSQPILCYVLIHTRRGLGLLWPILAPF